VDLKKEKAYPSVLKISFTTKPKGGTLLSYCNRKSVISPAETPGSVLEEIIREGARKMLQAAIENEVEEYLEKHKDERDTSSYRLAVRNGILPDREIITGVGPLRIRQPSGG